MTIAQCFLVQTDQRLYLKLQYYIGDMSVFMSLIILSFTMRLPAILKDNDMLGMIEGNPASLQG